MRRLRLFVVFAAACAAVLLGTLSAQAVSPRNPYRTFNLSGINYGSMQWERSHRQGTRAWPSKAAPTRKSRRYRGGSS
jgi:hypothetical protein